MNNASLKFKNDKYRSARGGYSRFLNLSCASCESSLFLYQKDGPGPLKRIYLDRILSKISFVKHKEFTCRHCKKIIGTFFIYKKENRPAIRLYQDSIVKKIKNKSSL